MRAWPSARTARCGCSTAARSSRERAMLVSYLKLAWKVLLRRKFYTFASLFGGAFTLVVLTVGATVLDHVFGPHSPETRLDRTLGVYGLAMNGPESTRTGFPGWPFLQQHLVGIPGADRV